LDADDSSLCRASQIAKALQRRNATDQRERSVPGDDEDYIQLEDFATPVANADFDCPGTLQEMQKKVKDARTRASRTQAMMATFATSGVDNEDEDDEHAVQDPYDMFC
jgi:hypothetical protein